MLPNWITRIPWTHIRDAAEENRVPAKLLAALCQQESSGNPWATRFEMNYRYLYNVKQFAADMGTSTITEEMHQKTSWGLCQVMGANAREHGFLGPLPMLCLPEYGLKYTCLYIKDLAKKYTSQTDIIAAYNAGSPIKGTDGKYKNQDYVDHVLMLLRDLDTVIP